jgi:hypothetical protein
MKDQTEARIKERLDDIKEVRPRNPQAASRGRAQFLSQAVSASEAQRQNGWTTKSRKERFAMNVMIVSVMIAGLLFGGGATVNAAQDDLPNEPLYALKLWSENVSLQLQNGDEAKADRLMELAQVRLQEMTRLVDAGQPVPDQVMLRLEQHIQQALQTCLTMDDPTLERTLLRIRDRLQDQDRDMEQLQLRTQDQQQLLTQTRTMLRERLQLVEDGLLNHEMFRYQVQNGFSYGQNDEVTPPVQNGNGQQNQNGQSSETPGGPNLNPGGPNIDPSGPNSNPGGPNIDPNGSNTDPNGPNTDPNGPNTDPNGPNTDPNGPNTDPNGPNTDPNGPNNNPGTPTTEPGGPNTNNNKYGGNDS